MQRMPNTVVFLNEILPIKKYLVWVENTYLKERK